LDKITVALVGSESLLGREIRDIVATSAPDLGLRLIAADGERPGTLTRMGDEPAVVNELDACALKEVRAVFLAGSAESTGKALGLLAGQSVPAIDLTAAAEEHPAARLRAPMVEREAGRDAGRSRQTSASAIHVVAHPAAIALALFLRRLHAHDAIRRAVIEILAPASEHGAAGVEELQQQTISLLSFKSMPRAVFDTQSAFNLLARYGEKAPVPLEDSELRIERHLATLLALAGDGAGEGNAAPMPSLRLIQAPVFHGYSFSAWVEFESHPGIEALESGLVSGPIEVRGAEFDPPTNVGQAGQNGVSIGAIMPDRNHPEAAWFWGVADNLRLTGENAVAVARELI
jgi:aspartate-semialdehyde dehydrogenase